MLGCWCGPGWCGAAAAVHCSVVPSALVGQRQLASLMSPLYEPGQQQLSSQRLLPHMYVHNNLALVMVALSPAQGPLTHLAHLPPPPHHLPLTLPPPPPPPQDILRVSPWRNEMLQNAWHAFLAISETALHTSFRSEFLTILASNELAVGELEGVRQRLEVAEEGNSQLHKAVECLVGGGGRVVVWVVVCLAAGVAAGMYVLHVCCMC